MWNSDLYLKFEKERTQPSVDLANRVRCYKIRKALDIGCGPGNSTTVIKNVFPDADITGIDSSKEMITKASADYPDIQFCVCDAREIEKGYDLLFSNACLQWIEDHDTLLPLLMDKLQDGGVLAVQLPMNGNEPLYREIASMVADPKWGLSGKKTETNETLLPTDYYNILCDCSSFFETWETVYCHSLPTHAALLDFVRSTRLRPFLELLDKDTALEFEKELLSRAEKIYPAQKNGMILFHFRRFFFIAEK